MEQFTVYVIVGVLPGRAWDLSSVGFCFLASFRFVEFRFCFMKSLGKVGVGVKGVLVKFVGGQSGQWVNRTPDGAEAEVHGSDGELPA